MINDSVILEKKAAALWITINRPEKRNAMNADVIVGIADGYRKAHDDADVRAIVLTGQARRSSAPASISLIPVLPLRRISPGPMATPPI